MAALIEVKGLIAGYPDRPRVLDGVNLSIEKGSRGVLLGANGSGKTTLLRCLCGSHEPRAGVVEVAGEALRYDRKALRTHRRRVQLVLQDPDEQLFSADVRQDVSFGPTNMGLDRAETLTRVDDALDMLSITHLADRPCHQLSFGERKRVAIAGAVAMRPEVLLLDEPTAGLDPVGVRETIAILERLREAGTTVVLSTHDVDLALSQADWVVIVIAGQVRQGPATIMLRDAEVVDAARLEVPWPLALANALGRDDAPRNISEVVEMLNRPSSTSTR